MSEFETLMFEVFTICICLCRFFQDFELVSVLGAGGFGCVVKAKHKLDGEIYAVKILEKTRSENTMYCMGHSSTVQLQPYLTGIQLLQFKVFYI